MEKTNQSDLPQAAKDYIDAVIKAMKYRRSVRGDVRQELTDHFIDALADCGNEREKQECAKELLAEFGDVKLLGKLLRRAKKRCRPLWRTIAARMFQFIGVCFLVLILYIGWFFSGKPIITTNYLEVMNQQVRPAAEESQNAWPHYEKAFALYAAFDEQAFDNTLRSLKNVPEQEQQVLQQWLSKNQAAMELIRRGNQRPYCWRTYSTGQSTNTELIAVLMPELQMFKKMSYLFCWNGLVKAEQGHWDEAFDSVFESYQLGMHLRSKNILIEQLVAIAIEAMSTKTMQLLLDENFQKMDSAILNSIRNRFEAIVSDEEFTVGFEGEKLFVYDEIQRSFTQTRLGSSHLYVQRLNQLWPVVYDFNKLALNTFNEEELPGQWLHILFTHPNREQTLAAADRFFAEMNELAGYRPAALRNKGIEVSKRMTEITKGNLLLGLMTPALEKVMLLSYRNKADSEATLAILAVLEYQKKNGVLPENLNVLVESGLLKEVPIDPFSDKPLVYRKTDDGFTLYSVSLNFTDDGGVPGTDSEGKPRNWGENGDHIFWPVDVQ